MASCIGLPATAGAVIEQDGTFFIRPMFRPVHSDVGAAAFLKHGAPSSIAS
jgi:hypothetical protein